MSIIHPRGGDRVRKTEFEASLGYQARLCHKRTSHIWFLFWEKTKKEQNNEIFKDLLAEKSYGTNKRLNFIFNL